MEGTLGMEFGKNKGSKLVFTTRNRDLMVQVWISEGLVNAKEDVDYDYVLKTGESYDSDYCIKTGESYDYDYVLKTGESYDYVQKFGLHFSKLQDLGSNVTHQDLSFQKLVTTAP
jgi:hypothetical protein